MNYKHTFRVALATAIFSACLIVPNSPMYESTVKHTKAMFSSAELKEFNCLTANLFFEARGESLQGLQAVADVTINRSNSGKYPENICKVVFQPQQFSWTHEQSKSNIQNILKGNLNSFKIQDKEAYARARAIAYKAYVLNHKVLPESALFYHAKSVKPYWSNKFEKVAVIGNHIFYKEG